MYVCIFVDADTMTGIREKWMERSNNLLNYISMHIRDDRLCPGFHARFMGNLDFH